jgi:hypothetical protein
MDRGHSELHSVYSHLRLLSPTKMNELAALVKATVGWRLPQTEAGQATRRCRCSRCPGDQPQQQPCTAACSRCRPPFGNGGARA